MLVITCFTPILASRVAVVLAALVLASCATPRHHDAPSPPPPDEKRVLLACHSGEHLADVTRPASPPPSPLRWLGLADEMRGNVRTCRRTESVCMLTVRNHSPEQPDASLSSRQIFELAQAQAWTASCLLQVMNYGRAGVTSRDRPFIPPLDAEGKCAGDEALVIEIRSSAESLCARAFEARAPEPDACTASPTLPFILHEQAFLALTRGDFQTADSLYARIESTCPSQGYAPMAALRRADVAYEAALAGDGDWTGVDAAYARALQACEKPGTPSHATGPSETSWTNRLAYPVPCRAPPSTRGSDPRPAPRRTLRGAAWRAHERRPMVRR